MGDLLTCPECRKACIDFHDYESMIVVARDFALFTPRCPACGARVSSMQAIPEDMREEVRFAAIQVGAGMGREL